MTSWEQHHPPHDHPGFDGYLDSLTEEDLAALNAANHNATTTSERDTDNDL